MKLSYILFSFVLILVLPIGKAIVFPNPIIVDKNGKIIDMPNSNITEIYNEEKAFSVVGNSVHINKQIFFLLCVLIIFLIGLSVYLFFRSIIF